MKVLFSLAILCLGVNAVAQDDYYNAVPIGQDYVLKYGIKQEQILKMEEAFLGWRGYDKQEIHGLSEPGLMAIRAAANSEVDRLAASLLARDDAIIAGYSESLSFDSLDEWIVFAVVTDGPWIAQREHYISVLDSLGSADRESFTKNIFSAMGPQTSLIGAGFSIEEMSTVWEVGPDVAHRWASAVVEKISALKGTRYVYRNEYTNGVRNRSLIKE